MTDEELAAIEEVILRAQQSSGMAAGHDVAMIHAPALLAEVRSLRAEREKADKALTQALRSLVETRDERDALRTDAALVQKYRLEGCVLVPVSRELLSEDWSKQPLCIRLNDNGDGTHTMILRSYPHRARAMKFRKMPVVIEAEGPLTSDNVLDIMRWCDAKEWDDAPATLTIQTLEGVMTASEGDWIIKGVKGEFYPCKPDIFAATYERVTEATP